MDLIVLKPEDRDAILEFERARASRSGIDEMERELLSWKARWRPEELEHYLPLGWSFGAWRGGDLAGYVLTQPLLFFRGLTQTLWVEQLAFDDVEAGEALLESAYRWARDKHFQTVLISELPPELKSSRKMDGMKDRIMEMPSSRLI